MEKTYKVKFYYIDKYTSNLELILYTENQIIDHINRIVPKETNTLSEAIQALNEYKDWDVKYTYREFTNHDIEGNLKPDNSVTDQLDFAEFDEAVNKDKYIPQNYSKLNDKQKLTVCTFIDKNIQLRKKLDEQNQDKPKFISEKYVDILEDFVYKLFLATNYTEAEYMIAQMKTFNNVEDDKLIKYLHKIIENMTVKQLISRENEFETALSNKFWYEIIKEDNLIK